jgi:hypothetical protein
MGGGDSTCGNGNYEWCTPNTSKNPLIYNWCLRLFFSRKRHFTTILLIVA